MCRAFRGSVETINRTRMVCVNSSSGHIPVESLIFYTTSYFKTIWDYDAMLKVKLSHSRFNAQCTKFKVWKEQKQSVVLVIIPSGFEGNSHFLGFNNPNIVAIMDASVIPTIQAVHRVIHACLITSHPDGNFDNGDVTTLASSYSVLSREWVGGLGTRGGLGMSTNELLIEW